MNPVNVYRIGWHTPWKSWWKGWRRPWQAENDYFTEIGARRAFTRSGAERRIIRASNVAGWARGSDTEEGK